MEELIEVIIIITFFTIGVSMVLKAKLWAEWVKNFRKNGATSVLSLGMVDLFLGSIIVSLHWVWEGFSMIVTIIGLMIILRSLIMLFSPNHFLKMIDIMEPRMNFLISTKGIVLTLIAVLLFSQLEIETGILTVPKDIYYFVIS